MDKIPQLDSAMKSFLLWKASCSLGALATLFESINSEEIQLSDEDFFGISELIRSAIVQIEKVRISEAEA